jgi:pimeloyl-ACP methyl ester carboxylesterase
MLITVLTGSNMELHYHLWPLLAGENPAKKSRILLLHGLGGTGALWRPIAASLEDEFDILALDQRGHGKSQNPSLTRYLPEDYGQDIVETLTHLKFSPVLGVGHSMGVRSLVAAAHLRPELFSTLVLVDLGLSGLAGGGLGVGFSDFLKLLPPHFSSRDDAKKFMQEHCPDPAIGQYLMAVSVRDPQGGISFPFDHPALLQTLTGADGFSIRKWLMELAEQKKTVYLLRGTNSLVWGAENFAQEKASFAKYETVHFMEFENAGHGLPFEQRARFTELLRSLA